ncbi:MAG: rRNA pseudouridine synthase [Bacteriovoracaceae bacterium]|jgi:23S rRNA pseudouridine2605 synthase|nr:rRNA pseudouridine synthase [Bacteriovoracaceae bacterium]
MAVEIRLQKYIADCGVTSRRKAEALILQGRVTINNNVITELGTKVNCDADVVQVDGDIIDIGRVEKLYIVLNKPRGYMTTLDDPEGRKTIMELVKEIPERIYPVGRLDYLSEGLLIMTNDGELANKIIHPSAGITKVYEVKIFGVINEAILTKLRNGVQTEEGFLKPTSVRVIKQMQAKTWIEFRLQQGRNREIRRICEAMGLTVDKLKRVAIGGLSINGIAPGRWMIMSKSKLMESIGLDKHGILDQEKVNYVSLKKTVNLRRKSLPDGPRADDEVFHMYRRETYFETLNNAKIKAKDERRKVWEESMDKKETAHKKRKDKKDLRQLKKDNHAAANAKVKMSFEYV